MMFVDPKYRRYGIATQINKPIFKWIKSKKVKLVDVKLFSDNEKSLKIYKKRGFKENSINLKLEL